MRNRKSPSWASFAILLIIVANSILLLLGMLGQLHPAFDAIGHFRAHLAAGMAILAIALLPTAIWREALMALIFAIAIFASTLLYNTAGSETANVGNEGDRTYSMIQFNARFDNADPELLIDILTSQQPDFVTLEETTPSLVRKLAEVRDIYPYQHICLAKRIVGGTAILSRHTWADAAIPECRENGLFARSTINMDGVLIDVVALHLYWPWPHRQPAQIERVVPFLKTLGQNAIVAGDFNATPWSAAVQQIASAGGTNIISPGPTWLTFDLPNSMRPMVGLPIDHVLVKGIDATGSANTLGYAGSDHLPVLLRFRIGSRPNN